MLDLEVHDFLLKLKPSERARLRRRFAELLESPDRWAEYEELHHSGRTLEVTICGKFAIKFWDDFADRYVKILEVVPSDRTSWD